MSVGAAIDRRIRVKLRGAAKELLKCRAPEVLLAGPAGTGKSFAALYKVHLMCLANPGMRALVVRKTHKSLTSTGLVTFREQVAKEAIAAGVCKWYGGSGEKPAQYIYDNGSAIVVGGLDNADKIMSAEYDIAYVQEATDLIPDDWEKINSRLRNGVVSFQQLLADCNPQQPRHWLKTRCDEGRTVMLYGKHEDNPRLFDLDPASGQHSVTSYGKAYLERLDNLTGVRKERLRYGRWAAAEGLIYGDWNPSVHLSDRKRLPFTWPRIWAVDFGFVHPFVWQQWAVDDDGALWLEREIHMTKRIVEDHCKKILEVVTHGGGKGAMPDKKGAWIYPKPSAILCDHDAEDRATFERHIGMSTAPAHKQVSPGIQACEMRLRVKPNGRPGMYVLREALVERDPELAEAGEPMWFGDEIGGYVWQPAPDGKLAKDQPLKERDDSMDTWRYVVAHQDIKARPRVRWIS